MTQPAATGISDRPITVMMLPVTTCGKNRTILKKNGAMTRPARPLTNGALETSSALSGALRPQRPR